MPGKIFTARTTDEPSGNRTFQKLTV
ncbi:uncharacterized protein METZ01_LOCUS243299 [marine metagenome]|uniref:Uncharacterized protein n=1 Tax=marine metagenome TaxID=408172 RepID=A0A382HTM6_9ZZZZ